MTYLLDSNVIIDLLNGNSNVLAGFKNAFISDSVRIPDIVYYEVLRGFEYSDPKNQKAGFEIFAKRCGIEYIDLSSLQEAAQQYASGFRARVRSITASRLAKNSPLDCFCLRCRPLPT